MVSLDKRNLDAVLYPDGAFFDQKSDPQLIVCRLIVDRLMMN